MNRLEILKAARDSEVITEFTPEDFQTIETLEIEGLIQSVFDATCDCDSIQITSKGRSVLAVEKG